MSEENNNSTDSNSIQEKDPLVSYARSELDLILGKDELDVAMKNSLISVIKEFSKEEHSGYSAQIAIHFLTRLLKFLPISPLTGEDSEWIDIDGKGLFQSNRCPRVFKQDDKAYDIDAIYFEDNSGTYSSIDCRVEIQFPYTPRDPIKVQVPDEASHELKRKLTEEAWGLANTQ